MYDKIKEDIVKALKEKDTLKLHVVLKQEKNQLLNLKKVIVMI